MNVKKMSLCLLALGILVSVQPLIAQDKKTVKKGNYPPPPPPPPPALKSELKEPPQLPDPPSAPVVPAGEIPNQPVGMKGKLKPPPPPLPAPPAKKQID